MAGTLPDDHNPAVLGCRRNRDTPAKADIVQPRQTRTSLQIAAGLWRDTAWIAVVDADAIDKRALNAKAVNTDLGAQRREIRS